MGIENVIEFEIKENSKIANIKFDLFSKDDKDIYKGRDSFLDYIKTEKINILERDTKYKLREISYMFGKKFGEDKEIKDFVLNDLTEECKKIAEKINEEDKNFSFIKEAYQTGLISYDEQRLKKQEINAIIKDIDKEKKEQNLKL